MESFVTAEEAAAFLCITRRRLLELARKGQIPAHAVDESATRKTWRFRLSELAANITGKNRVCRSQ